MSLLQEYGSALASIIGSRPEKLTEWEPFKLSSEWLPAQLHAMFWGKSMADEEQKWRGTGLGNERQGGDEPDVSEEEDDDIIEGCYSLSIGIESFAFPRIWIRAEYIRIYDALEARYKKSSYPYLASAVIISGQPGVGA